MTEFSNRFSDQKRKHRPTLDISVTMLTIVAFWLFYLLTVSMRSWLLDYPGQLEQLIQRSVVTVCGVLTTIILYYLLRWFEQYRISLRIAAALILSVPASFLIAVVNHWVFSLNDPINLFDNKELAEQIKAIEPIVFIVEFALTRYFFLVSWAMLYLAMSYAAEVRMVERRATRFARAAQQAEMRSLRYQVNPHFLFNTLNSLSALVLRNRPDDAEAMIMNLSIFYRHSLSGDPLDDVPLHEEVYLQRLYLDIEAVRFPKRLKVAVDLPDEVRNCCVPGLILQPLVENAIKYGVSRATRPVLVEIIARRDGDELLLSVRDDGDVIPDDQDSGSGIGLANVRDRLEARFGFAASMRWYQREGGGFIVDLRLPMVLDNDEG